MGVPIALVPFQSITQGIIIVVSAAQVQLACQGRVGRGEERERERWASQPARPGQPLLSLSASDPIYLSW